jgi:hypothetical protein
MKLPTKVEKPDPATATADEMNRWLWHRGLRPCPHSHHSSDEDFTECANGAKPS